MRESESGVIEAADWTRLNGVPARVSSSRFVGRRAELTRLEETWKAAVAEEHAELLAAGTDHGVERVVVERAL